MACPLVIGSAYQAFRDDGSLADEKQAARVANLGTILARHLAKLLA